jgi:hypothetical protein
MCNTELAQWLFGIRLSAAREMHLKKPIFSVRLVHSLAHMARLQAVYRRGARLCVSVSGCLKGWLSAAAAALLGGFQHQ